MLFAPSCPFPINLEGPDSQGVKLYKAPCSMVAQTDQVYLTATLQRYQACQPKHITAQRPQPECHPVRVE